MDEQALEWLEEVQVIDANFQLAMGKLYFGASLYEISHENLANVKFSSRLDGSCTSTPRVLSTTHYGLQRRRRLVSRARQHRRGRSSKVERKDHSSRCTSAHTLGWIA